MGLGVVVTHLFDGPIAMAAACELALALPKTLACGLDVHDGLTAWPPCDVPQRRNDCLVSPNSTSGLGVCL
jgi:L-alanine-DL-glutamate epimerase-like enolase superfamily enzyme